MSSSVTAPLHLHEWTTCRVCGSRALTPAIDLGPQYLQGSFVKEGTPSPTQQKFPTTLVRCDPSKDPRACGLLQMRCSVPSDVLYTNYWYHSGTNATMRNHLKGVAEEAMRFCTKRDARALDIGCNDCTLFQYYPDTFENFGVDPSNIPPEFARGATIVRDFFPSKKLEEALHGKTCDIITSIAMFYDLENPIEFAKRIRTLLSPEGIWIVEMSYMPRMLELNSYDTICHEHLEYYSLSVLEHIVRAAGMKIVHASLNESNGGSIRCVVTAVSNMALEHTASQQTLEELRRKEHAMHLDTDAPYREFQHRIEAIRDELHGLVARLKQEGKRVHLYGASTKGNTILQWCNIDHTLVDVAAERNPDKFGAKTLGTNIPIVSEAESRAMHPDYYLVLPWHFREEFLTREQEMLAHGVGFIFPLPTVEVYRQ